MHVHIAGLGYSGQAIARELLAAGFRVSGLNRSGISPVPGVDLRAADVLQPGTLVPLRHLPPVDWMVCALSGTGTRDPVAYRSLYVDGPASAADALPWSGPRRVLFLGSTGVFGDTQGDWVDESTPPDPAHRAGEVQCEAEAALAAVTDTACILRLSGLYGPGRVRLIRQALRRRPYLKPDIWSNQVHRDDVAGAVRFVLTQPTPPPPLLLLSDPAPALRREIFDWVRHTLQAPDGWYDEDHPHRAQTDRGNKRVSSRRIQALGYTFRVPDYRAGLRPELPEARR